MTKQKEIQIEKPLIITLIIMSVLFAAYLSWTTVTKPAPIKVVGTNTPPTETLSETPTIVKNSPEPEPIISPRPSNAPKKGATLSEIKYTLPENWLATLSAENLFIQPEADGGFISISAYDYPVYTGRRAFYCKTAGTCIDSTYFEETMIGNISGYVAESLDNSGGGPVYFGSKGDKFYIISTYSPPDIDEEGNYRLIEYSKNFQNVMDSLTF